MPLRLFNTLSRQIEDFKPRDPKRVTLYTCGPTVWNYAHIGNFRTFVFEDVLRRYLEYSGFGVLHVMNLTDVDDRTINAANQAGVRLAEHVKPFTQAFFEDRDYLRIEPATHYPAATTHIPAMIALVERLLKKGVAYKGEDGSVYFAIARFPGYGKLSKVESRTLKDGARVDSDEYSKEDARDFVLWKAAKPDDEAAGAAWDAPFGRGRPGWHLECSAMAQQYLGDTIDIHAGGVDLIFPHHEDEIAQSEAASGKPFARVWMHGEFLQVGGTKMSKRFGNFLTARDLKEGGWDAAAIRYLFGQTHYRRQLNFTDDAIKAASQGAQRLAELRRRLVEPPAGALGRSGALADAAARMETGFRAAMDEDLDVPGALAVLMTFVREANAELDKGDVAAGARQAALEAFDRVTRVLQVVPRQLVVEAKGASIAVTGGTSGFLVIPAWVSELAEERRRAKAARDFARADQIRKTLLDKGFEVRDTRDGGFEVRRVTPPPTDT
ncbi:MAG: cysteine--tRNA ligase [Gemmatimonadales bacterium]